MAYVLLSDLIRHTHGEDSDAVILQVLRIERCTVKNCNVLIKVTGQLGLVNSFSSEMHSYEHALVDVHVFLAVRHKQNDVIDCVTVVARRREEDIVRLVETSRHVRFLVIIPSIQMRRISSAVCHEGYNSGVKSKSCALKYWLPEVVDFFSDHGFIT